MGGGEGRGRGWDEGWGEGMDRSLGAGWHWDGRPFDGMARTAVRLGGPGAYGTWTDGQTCLSAEST